MDINEENLKILNDYLQKTLSPDPEIRWPAEKFLRSVEGAQNYPILLLSLINTANVDLNIRVAGAITLKNFIKKNWPIDDDGNDRIFAGDRDKIKAVIVDSMLTAPNLIQKQLSDAISIIGKHDFPAKWPTLLTGMVEKFSTGDFNIINGVLHTAHSIFKRYRHEFKSNELWTEIKFVLDTFAKPLTELFLATHNLAAAHSNNPEALKVIYSSLLLICKIFYSLNCQDLPEFFEDNMGTWMPQFQTLLKTNIKCLETDMEDEPGLMEQIKSQVCFNVQLYAQMYDEEFRPYLPNFVMDIWDLLVNNTNLLPKYDLLVSHALRFLSTVASRSSYKQLFDNSDTLTDICQKVIIENIQFRDSDMELFEDNPDEYMKRDLEGSDVETRRRAACELVRALSSQFEERITAIFSEFVKIKLEKYQADPRTKWREKNAAIYLVIALASKGSTQRHGVTLPSSLVNIADFARQYILPELDGPIEMLYVTKADSIKYMLQFRSVLPPEVVVASLPLVMKHLRSTSLVVHSYAATFVAAVLVVRTSNNTPLVSGDSLNTMAGELLQNLFYILTLKGSEENEYAMKAIMRCFGTLGERVVSYLAQLLPKLSEKLAQVAKNPTKPHFNHYLFETLALSINIVCRKNLGAVSSFEEVMFPIFQVILQEDVQDFLPYVFQVLSVLLGYHAENELPPPYLALYPCLLAPALWERQGNVKPLTALLKAIISKTQPQLYYSGAVAVSGLLGVFQKLVSSRANDHEGFNLIQSMLENVPRDQLEPFLKQVLMLLFQRAMSSKTPKYIKGLVIFFCTFVIYYGGQYFVEIVDQIQPQMFAMVCEKLLIPECPKVETALEKKITAVGLTKLMTQATQLIDGPYSQHWSNLVKTCLAVLEGCGGSIGNGDDEEAPDDAVEVAYATDAAYSQLIYAGIKKSDPAKDVADPRQFLAVELSKLSSAAPGKLTPVITQCLTAAEQQVLQSYLARAGVSGLG